MRPNWARLWFGWLGAVVVVLVIFFMMGGRFTPETGAIQIDFSMDEKTFVGLEVEIDGEVVGELKHFGAMMRSGFEVEPGEHEVRVLHPEFRCEPARVEVEAGEGVLLLLDYGSVASSYNRSETVLTFQY
jgi:hypothetical protein